MIRTAVLLTVFNRKEVTLKGLYSLKQAMATLGKAHLFDIYMVDDGCTDGTGDAVAEAFPEVRIIEGNGKLFWGGGMRKAWQAAEDSGVRYDFFLWFNDDVDLFGDALESLFDAYGKYGPDCLISGAFQAHDGTPSYGGRLADGRLAAPDGSCRELVLMNGNLVLIPYAAYSVLGMIDKSFRHGLGDQDYGLRARNNHFKVCLTEKYVGICDRHDEKDRRYFSPELNLKSRLKLCYNTQNSPRDFFIYMNRHYGLIEAIVFFLWRNFYTFFPRLYVKKRKRSANYENSN